MLKTSINLPKQRRLHISVVKSRNNTAEEPIFPDLGKVFRARSGSKFSRFFAHIFAHKNLKKVFGINIALILMASAFIPSKINVSADVEQNVVAEESVPLTTETGVRYPVNIVSITQGYSYFHPAVDLDGITGDPIHPIMPGKVASVSYSKYNYGESVIIDHGNGLTSLYAHLSKIDVYKGETVDYNTLIGLMGATGHAFGDHLHLEIRDHGKPINPLTVLPR